MKRCFVIILNYKKWEDTLACVNAVTQSTYENISIVVIDNNSGNKSLEHIEQGIYEKHNRIGQPPAIVKINLQELSGYKLADTSERIILLQNNINAGFASAYNAAFRNLIDDDVYIFMLNPDIIVEKTAIQHLCNAASEDADRICGLITKDFLQPNNILFYGGGRVRYASGTVAFITAKDQKYALEYISGGGLLMHSSSLKRWGLFPEEYFLYWEDADWCKQAVKKGATLYVSDKAYCYDKISTSIGRGFTSDYFYVRNALHFLKKYKAIFLATAIPAILLRLVKRMCLGQFSRAHGMWRGLIDFMLNERYENQ